MPAQQSKYDDTNPPISQAVQIWGEGPEIVPYAAGFVPPNVFLPGLGGNGGSGSVNGSGNGTSSTQVPKSYDLHWVAGDTAEFDFFFPGVCWTATAPADTLGLTWDQTVWEAQVRNPNWYYWGYWWPPTWPGYRFIMSFAVTSEFVASHMVDGVEKGPGTLVHLKGGTIWPGQFVWDLQTTQPDPDDATRTVVHTWYSGKATVDTQVTQQDLYPPSHWNVYPYP